MSVKIPVKQSFSLLASSLSCLFKNPKIFYPFAILAFLQLFLMEILFFAPRFPLSLFFGPIIARIKGAIYMQYPFNFELMNHWFQSAQIFIYLFATSLFVGKAILVIAKINQGQEVGDRLPAVGFKRYVNMMMTFLLIFLVMYGFTSVYGLLIRRAAQIVSTTGIYFLIKQAVLLGAPYFNLFFSMIVMTMFAFLLPLIVLEQKNIFVALMKNFKLLRSCLGAIFFLIFVSSLPYLPILLIRSNYRWFSTFTTPEGWQIFVIFGVFAMLFIDAVQYTAVTLCYFLTKDE